MTIGGHAHINNAKSCHASIQTTGSYLCYVCTVKTLVLFSVKCQIQNTCSKSSRDNWQTTPLLIETAPPTDIGHAPLQLPASWLWYLIQYPHLLLVHCTVLCFISCLTTPFVALDWVTSLHSVTVFNIYAICAAIFS